MAGTQRVIRYVVLAFCALLILLFLTSSTGVSQRAAEAARGWTYDSSGNAVPVNLEQGQKPQDGQPKGGQAEGTQPEDDQPVVQKPGKTPNTNNGTPLPPPTAPGDRMNATFVTLARNSDIWEIAKSIRHVEDRFNRKFNYDWVFLNDDDFSDDFKKLTTALVSGKTKYGKIPKEHWSFPEFIDQNRAAEVREQMKEAKIIYGDSISYRHMCRYESGFFFRHPLMLDYEWYWRVEPSIELFCDIEYDTFKWMADNKKKYSFVLSLYEYVETIPTLWDAVKNFTKAHPEHIAQGNSMKWLSDDNGETYNHCHFVRTHRNFPIYKSHSANMILVVQL